MKGTSKRIFVALPVSLELQRTAEGWAEEQRGLSVRWISGKNLHITLVPPWEEAEVEAVVRKLESLSGVWAPFSVSFRRVTFGPNPRRPRLIWAEGKTPSGLRILKRAVEDALKIRAEERPFRLHLTLARFREEEFQNFPQKELHDVVAWDEVCDKLVLMESRLSPKGADYEILAVFPAARVV